MIKDYCCFFLKPIENKEEEEDREGEKLLFSIFSFYIISPAQYRDRDGY